jgi:hypothetical protein
MACARWREARWRVAPKRSGSKQFIYLDHIEGHAETLREQRYAFEPRTEQFFPLDA